MILVYIFYLKLYIMLLSTQLMFLFNYQNCVGPHFWAVVPQITNTWVNSEYKRVVLQVTTHHFLKHLEFSILYFPLNVCLIRSNRILRYLVNPVLVGKSEISNSPPYLFISLVIKQHQLQQHNLHNMHNIFNMHN